MRPLLLLPFLLFLLLLHRLHLSRSHPLRLFRVRIPTVSLCPSLYFSLRPSLSPFASFRSLSPSRTLRLLSPLAPPSPPPPGLVSPLLSPFPFPSSVRRAFPPRCRSTLPICELRPPRRPSLRPFPVVSLCLSSLFVFPSFIPSPCSSPVSSPVPLCRSFLSPFSFRRLSLSLSVSPHPPSSLLSSFTTDLSHYSILFLFSPHQPSTPSPHASPAPRSTLPSGIPFVAISNSLSFSFPSHSPRASLATRPRFRSFSLRELAPAGPSPSPFTTHLAPPPTCRKTRQKKCTFYVAAIRGRLTYAPRGRREGRTKRRMTGSARWTIVAELSLNLATSTFFDV